MRAYFSVLLIAFLLLTTYYLLLTTTYAQSKGIEVTYVFDIPDEQAEDGDILINTENGIIRASKPYDVRLFGILEKNPVVVYRRVDNSGVPVTWHGVTQVNVSTINGPINTGDYITSSEISGKGMRAIKSGHVVGVALNSLTEEEAQPFDYQINDQTKTANVGKVNVALRIEYAEISRTQTLTRLFEALNSLLFASIKDPDKLVQIVRFLAAGLVIVAGFVIGFLTFSRSIYKGVEAIGRNPLARTTIQFSIILNIILTILTAIIGIAAAYIVLNL